jgi:hypothetical protein
MLFVSARIPTSFTCTSICKTTDQRKFCFNGRPERSGRLCFSKAAAGKEPSKSRNRDLFHHQRHDHKNQSKNPKKIRSESSAYSVPLW